MDIWKKVPENIRRRCGHIEESRKFTEISVEKIRQQFLPELRAHKGKVALAFAGSIGRKEAHLASDVDAFVLFEGDLSKREEKFAKDLLRQLKEFIETIGLRMASQGAFSSACTVKDLVTNIGGKKETNDTLTRRVLLICEGYGICSGQFFNQATNALLSKYLQELRSKKDREPVFLINDLIRYYRTICVDYEYKKNAHKKPWAVRLIKLRHSRKLLYFSALLPVIESINKRPGERVEWLEEQFTVYSPLDRLILLLHQYGEKQHWEIITCYNQFLEFLSSKERRDRLDKLMFERRSSDKNYVMMRDNARELRALMLDFISSVDHWQEPIQKYVIA